MFVRYSQKDITRAVIPSTSATEWIISPPARTLLAKSLIDPDVAIVNLDFRWSLTRNPPTGLVAQVVKGKHSSALNRTNEVRRTIADVLVNGSVSNVWVQFITKQWSTVYRSCALYVFVDRWLNFSLCLYLDQLTANPSDFPRFGMWTVRTEQWLLRQTVLSYNRCCVRSDALADCTLSLSMSTNTSKPDEDVVEWWNLNQTSKHVIPESKGSLEFIIFNEPVSPPAFSFLAGSS